MEKEGFCSRSWYRWACRQSTSQWAGRLHLGAVSLKHLNWWEAGSWSASLLPLLGDMCVSSARANHYACPQSAAQSCVCCLVIAKNPRDWQKLEVKQVACKKYQNMTYSLISPRSVCFCCLFVGPFSFYTRIRFFYLLWNSSLQWVGPTGVTESSNVKLNMQPPIN